MKKLLIFVDWFEPGFKAGGIVRSCVNLIGHMHEDFEIFVMTRDTDYGETRSYEGIESNKWVIVKKNVCVFYASVDWISYGNMKSEIINIRPDIIYLNSMFSIPFTLYPILLKRFFFDDITLVLAPRGMLKASALKYKKWKKRIFLMAFKLFNLQKKIIFQATDDQEYRDIISIFEKKTVVRSIPDFPGVQPPFKLPREKLRGEIKMVFIGRIHPIKNLLFLLSVLSHLSNKIQLTVIGKVEDQGYWDKCNSLISSLPSNCTVLYRGELNHSKIQTEIQANDLLVHPTTGENFGHVIFEALSAGRPVLISDQTPWQGLSEHNAGWVVSTKQEQKYAEVINSVSDMDNKEFSKLCHDSWNFCNTWLGNLSLKEDYKNLFSRVANEA